MARADVARRLAKRDEHVCRYCDKTMAASDRYVVSEGERVSGWCGAPSYTKGRLVTHKACWLRASLDGAIEDYRNHEALSLALALLDEGKVDLANRIKSELYGRLFYEDRGAANWAELLSLGACDINPEAYVVGSATDAMRRGQPVPFAGGERCTYCRETPSGYAELPSGSLVLACHRHKHAHVRTFAACCLCLGRMTSKGVVVDGETYHKACHAKACT